MLQKQTSSDLNRNSVGILLMSGKYTQVFDLIICVVVFLGDCCWRWTESFSCPERSSRCYGRVSSCYTTQILADTQYHFGRKELNHYFPSAYWFDAKLYEIHWRCKGDNPSSLLKKLNMYKINFYFNLPVDLGYP